MATKWAEGTTRDGIFVMVGGSLARILQAVSLGPLLSRIGNKKVLFFIAKINGRDQVLLKDLLEAEKIVPGIDRRYPLSEVAEALHYREDGHAQGKVVITIHEGEDCLATPMNSPAL
ncbi:MAG: zinc-binding dehydrogenase [Terracidiphilus sp.]